MLLGIEAYAKTRKKVKDVEKKIIGSAERDRSENVKGSGSVRESRTSKTTGDDEKFRRGEKERKMETVDSKKNGKEESQHERPEEEVVDILDDLPSPLQR